MTNLTFNFFFCFIILNSILNTEIKAQENTVTISQDHKFEQVLNEKRKINNTLLITDNYKIQLFNGESEMAKKTLIEFKKNFKNIDATIIFSTPTYKVWVGNFRTRLEGEKNLNLLKKKYPNAVIIKPNK